MFISLLLSFFINAFALWLVTIIVPGIAVDNVQTLALMAIVVGLINAFIKPIVKLFTLPISIVTLGLFGLVVNACLLIFASWFVPGFTIDGFLPALFGAIVLGIISACLGLFLKRE